MDTLLKSLLIASFTVAAHAESVLVVSPLNPTSIQEKQAETFARIYATFCLKHLQDLEKLRLRMTMVSQPQLPKDKAEFFLQGAEGQAWTVPEPTGAYVIAMPKGQNQCFVYAHRASQNKSQQAFTSLANATSGTLNVKKIYDGTKVMPFGNRHKIIYEWSDAGSSKRAILELHTTDSETASMQAYASATMISPK